jgi:hypothetical protein
MIHAGVAWWLPRLICGDIYADVGVRGSSPLICFINYFFFYRFMINDIPTVLIEEIAEYLSMADLRSIVKISRENQRIQQRCKQRAANIIINVMKRYHWIKEPDDQPYTSITWARMYYKFYQKSWLTGLSHTALLKNIRLHMEKDKYSIRLMVFNSLRRCKSSEIAILGW